MIFFKNWPQLAQIYSNLVGVHLRNIQTKFEANPCSGLKEAVKVEKFMTITTMTTDTRCSLESCSLSLIRNDNSTNLPVKDECLCNTVVKKSTPWVLNHVNHGNFSVRSKHIP